MNMGHTQVLTATFRLQRLVAALLFFGAIVLPTASGCNDEETLDCDAIAGATWEHRLSGGSRPLRVRRGAVLSLDPRSSDDPTGAVCLDLDGDATFDVKLEADELPYLLTIDENTPSVIYLAADGVTRPVALQVIAEDCPEADSLWRKNGMIEVLTSNICKPCRALDDFLHAFVVSSVHPDGTPFDEGAFMVIKHHENDTSASAYATERATALRLTTGNPYSYVDGKTELYGWKGESEALEMAIDTALSKDAAAAVEAQAWLGCEGQDSCVDVTLNVHLRDRNRENLRLHILVTESGIIPGYPNVYFEANDYVSVAGVTVDLAAVDADTIHIDRNLLLARAEGEAYEWDARRLSVVVFVEDLSDCSEVLDTRCRILNSTAVTLEGHPGQGSIH